MAIDLTGLHADQRQHPRDKLPQHGARVGILLGQQQRQRPRVRRLPDRPPLRVGRGPRGRAQGNRHRAEGESLKGVDTV